MKTGQILKYLGKGFIGFDPENLEMKFIKKDGYFDYWVEYNGREMLVRKNEVEIN